MRKSDFKFDKNCKNTAYVLGFIWADGYLNHRKGSYERVSTEIVEKDFNDIYNIFNNIGIHLFSTKRVRINRQPQASFGYSDKVFIDFLIANDFINRKEKGFSRILKNFSKKTLPFFIKGLFDGDGCFYFNKKNSTSQISLSSSYTQDYSGFIEILQNLRIKFSIKRIKSVNSYSVLRITSKKDCIIFSEFLKDSLEFGLKRKTNKILELLKPSEKINQSKFKSVDCFDLEGNFIKNYKNIKETTKDGFTPTTVCQCCLGKFKTHKKRIWAYGKKNNNTEN